MKKNILVYVFAFLIVSCGKHKVELLTNQADQAFEKLNKNNTDSIISLYTKILKIDNRNTHAYARRGTLYNIQGNYNHALVDLLIAVKLDSLISSNYTLLGSVYKALDNSDNAIKAYKRAIAIDSNYLALNNIAQQYTTISKFDSALKYYNVAINMYEDSSIAYYNRGVLKERMKDARGAIEDLNIAIAKDSLISLYYYSRSISKNSLDNIRGAIADVSKAIEIEKIPYYFYCRGELYYKIGLFDESCKDLDYALLYGVSEAELHFKERCMCN